MCCLFAVTEELLNLSDGDSPTEQPEQRRPIVLHSSSSSSGVSSGVCGGVVSTVAVYQVYIALLSAVRLC